MATRVGTAVTGTNDAASNSIASAAKDTTGASQIVGGVKWEVTAPVISTITDTAGNSYSWTEQLGGGGTNPHAAVYWSTGTFIANAANVVTVTFTTATATFKRVIQDSWAGLSATVQDTKTSTGTTSPYSTAALTTTGPGLAYAMVADFSTLSAITATGTPTFTIAATMTDCFAIYYISSTGQTITPGATATGAVQWAMVAKAFADVPASSPPVGRPMFYPQRVFFST